MRRHLSRHLAKSLKERLICRRWIPKLLGRRSLERVGKLGLLNWLSRAWQSRYLYKLCKHIGWFNPLRRLRALVGYPCKIFLWSHLRHPDGVFQYERLRSIASIHCAILRWWMEWTGRLGLRTPWDFTVRFRGLRVLCELVGWLKPVPSRTRWRKRQPILGGCLQC